MDFKVGDKVRLTGRDWGRSSLEGKIVTVDHFDGSERSPVVVSEDEEYFDVYQDENADYSAELVTDEEEPAPEPQCAPGSCYPTHHGLNWPRNPHGDFTLDPKTLEAFRESTISFPILIGLKDDATAVVPDHYGFPGGVRVHQISGWLTSNAGQAVQYITRSSRIDGQNKDEDPREALKKAIRFLNLEIERLEDRK